MEQGLLAVSVDNNIEHSAFLDARYLYQHAKLYIADEAAAVVTSANLSYHGMVIRREASIRVVQYDDVCYFVQRFDKYFERAESITQDLIDLLRAWVDARTPFEVNARALIELYGLPDEDIPPQLVAHIRKESRRAQGFRKRGQGLINLLLWLLDNANLAHECRVIFCGNLYPTLVRCVLLPD